MQPEYAFESEVFSVIDFRDNKVSHKEMPETASFHRADWAWLASKVGPRKTAERLSEYKDRFRITVMMHGTKGPWSAGAKEARKIAEDSGILKISPNHINIMLFNNVAAPWNHIPLTPWMVLHRAAHCISLEGSGHELQKKHPFKSIREIIPGKPINGNPFSILDFSPQRAPNGIHSSHPDQSCSARAHSFQSGRLRCRTLRTASFGWHQISAHQGLGCTQA